MKDLYRSGRLPGRLLSVILIAGLLLLLLNSNLAGMLTDINLLQGWFVGQGVGGYLLLVVCFIVATLFALPIAALLIVAGIVYGPILGGMLSLFASTLGATLAFLTARYALRGLILHRYGDNVLFQRIDDGVAQNGSRFLLLTRLVPVFPFSFQSYAYGLTRLNAVVYVVLTFICMVPVTFLYTYMASEFALYGVSASLLLKMAGAGLLLFLLSQLPSLVLRYSERYLDRTA